MMTSSRVPPWETATQLPAGLTGKLIAQHFKVQVDELRPEHIGEGLNHTKESLGRYRDPRITIQTNDDETNDKLTELYRKYPDLAVSGSVDGLGSIGIQNDSGLYFVIRGSWNTLLEPTEDLVKSWDGKPVTSDTKVDFANRCRGLLTGISEALNLSLELVSVGEFKNRMQPILV